MPRATVPPLFRRVLSALAAVTLLAAGAAPALAGVPSQLKVFKYITGDVNPPGLLFSITVSCADPEYTQTLQVPSEGNIELIDIPTPNQCTVTENLPLPAPPDGYAWNPDNTPPAPQTVFVPTGEEVVVSVFNNLLPLGGNGIVLVDKVVVGGAAPGAQFSVDIQCSSPPFATTVLVPAGGSVPVDGIPAPNTCTITESGALPPPPPGFIWNPQNTPPPPVTVPLAIGGTASVSLVNTLVGVPPPAPPQAVPGPGGWALTLLALLMIGLGLLRVRRSAA
ncbi:MAG: hypothetical protein KF823_05575 [Xanthomonadales bacterium]|nr:hypothetical protein [Xanthomonadales bacterium]